MNRTAGQVRHAGLLFLPLSIALSCFVTQQKEGTGFAAHGGEPTRMKTLVRQLGSKAFRAREEAMNALERYGESAMECLLEATHDTDYEISRRAALLIERLERTLGIARVGQLEFRPIVDREWSVPRRGESTEIGIALNVTARRDEPYRLLRSPALIVKDPSGKEISPLAYVDSYRPSSTPSLKKNTTYTIPFNARLIWDNLDLKLCTDLRDGSWVFFKLGKGIHQIAMKYSNEIELPGPIRLWKGEVQTAYIPVLIR